MSRVVWALLLVAACHDPAAAPTSPRLVAHKDFCVAAGLAIKEQSEAEGLPCWAVEARLERHVRTNEDCLAYWGDAGVDLRCGAMDGGTDGAD